MSSQDPFTFIEGRGVLVDVTGLHGSSGVYYVEGLPSGHQARGAVIIDNIQLGAKDQVAPMDALGDKHTLYVFGPTFKPMLIQGTIYLKACEVHDGVAIVNEFFEEHRVSKYPQHVNVSIDRIKTGMYITEMSFLESDANLNYIKFQIAGYAKPRKDA